MKRIGIEMGLGLAAAIGGTAMLIGCAVPATEQPSAQTSVWVRSHNRSPVDVYLLCGNQDAQWLGVLQPKESGAFEFPSARTRCAAGLNFFLVDRDHNRGYWVTPGQVRRDSRIDLVIEKYAGLSSASLRR
jgi:hypothetical protein